MCTVADVNLGGGNGSVTVTWGGNLAVLAMPGFLTVYSNSLTGVGAAVTVADPSTCRRHGDAQGGCSGGPSPRHVDPGPVHAEGHAAPYRLDGCISSCRRRVARLGEGVDARARGCTNSLRPYRAQATLPALGHRATRASRDRIGAKRR